VLDALSGGASGGVGRTIFQSADPAAMARKIADLIHGRHELT
jgi:DhnA family fructose-bisphosphate aldolase class Ia